VIDYWIKLEGLFISVAFCFFFFIGGSERPRIGGVPHSLCGMNADALLAFRPLFYYHFISARF